MILHGPQHSLSFAELAEFRKLKTEIHRLTGDDMAYYAVLKGFDLQKSSEIGSEAQRVAVLEALKREYNSRRWDATESHPTPVKAARGRKRTAPFTWQEQFEEMRHHLLWLTGDDERFYAILRRHNCNLATVTQAQSLEPYKEMVIERNRIQQERCLGPIDQELRETLTRASLKLGAGYAAILGARGCVSPEDVMSLDATTMSELLADLRDAAKATQENKA